MVSTPKSGLTSDDAELIRGLYPKLRRFAAVVGPAEIDPDDLVQDALMKTLRRQPLTSLDHPSSYLWTVMCNLSKDHQKRFSRERRALRRLGPPETANPGYPSDLDELDRIAPKARAVLYLHEIDGYTYAEIADLLGANEASLRRAASRARRTLREALEREESDAATR
jgi:RNA polymerase sigma-70 factor (ECF subfamily)